MLGWNHTASRSAVHLLAGSEFALQGPVRCRVGGLSDIADTFKPRRHGMTDRLLKALEHPRFKHLVYTSAGDHSNIGQWIRGPKRFDLWITYYGDDSARLIEHGDYYEVRKGGKYQNLHHVYKTWPELLQQYSAIFALDDDIIIGASAINTLFEVRERFDYWVLQPSFSPWGKISYPVTKVRRSCIRRHTNFAENGCALFKREMLDQFMQVYDPILVGWGIDWWYLEVMGPDLRGRIAIIDSVACTNPHDRTKGSREIARLQPTSVRRALWYQVKDQYHIKSEERGIVEYERFKRRLPAALMGAARDRFEASLIATMDRIRPRLGRLRTAAARLTNLLGSDEGSKRNSRTAGPGPA